MLQLTLPLSGRQAEVLQLGAGGSLSTRGACWKEEDRKSGVDVVVISICQALSLAAWAMLVAIKLLYMETIASSSLFMGKLQAISR